MSVFGFNILPQRKNSARILPDVARLKPRWTLVMDDHALALRLRSVGYGVIYRQYRPDDARLHETMTPAQFVQEHAYHVANGIVLQVLNEPVVNTLTDCKRLSEWLVDVRTLMPNARLAFPNFAMGNPHENLIQQGGFDTLIKGWRATDLLTLHEYAKRGDPLFGWLIGRYRFWLERFAALGKPLPEIVMTECGYDIGGGQGDGWHAHITAKQYVEVLRSIGAHYRRDKVSACIFCYGDGFGWNTFNIEGEIPIMDELIEQNKMAAARLAPPEWGDMRSVRITSVGNTPSATHRNIRQEPTNASPDLGDLVVGDVVDVSAFSNAAAGFVWRKVRKGSVVGYAALPFTWEAIVPLPTPVPPQPEDPLAIFIRIDIPPHPKLQPDRAARIKLAMKATLAAINVLVGELAGDVHIRLDDSRFASQLEPVSKEGETDNGN